MGHAMHGQKSQRAVLIAGPTASGKSRLALELAEKLGGVVINADSMQVYHDLRVITARPAPDEEARVPHRLYGHVDAAENYSVGRWCADIGGMLAEAAQAGRVPILVGGTGLYFKALTGGLAAVPAIPADVRAAVRARVEAEGPAALHAELTRRDPASAARITPADRPRIGRALEVVEATGRPLSDWHRDGAPAIVDPQHAAKVFLLPDRAALYRRIDDRFDAMVEAGALDEVRALERRGLDPTLPAMKAHGVPWLCRHLRGELALAEAAAAGKRDTRHYSKRQLTWFRHQMPGWAWAAPEAAAGLLQAQWEEAICA
jgi:tRNA dimethylallyltransferase